jgi:hypothetical protein
MNIGATSKGTQPPEWVNAVLRGRGGMAFEQALGVLKIFNVWGYKGWCWPPGSVMPGS